MASFRLFDPDDEARIVAIGTAAGAALAVVTLLLTDAPPGSWLPAVAVNVALGILGLVMLLTRRARLLPFLAAIAVGVAILPIVVPGDFVAVAGMAVLAPLAMLGLVASPWRRAPTAVFVVAFVVATAIAWTWPPKPSTLIVVAVVLASIAFGTTALSIAIDRSHRIAARFEALFRHAPVALFEEDFSEVQARLAALRAEGVTDLAAHLDAHPELVDELAASIRIIDANDEATALLGAPRIDLVGPLRPRSDGARAALVAQLLAVWEARRQATIALDGAVAADGRRFDALLYWSVPVVDGELDLAHVTVALADVTAQREAERQLAEAVEAREAFIATVSHELRTPLTVVLGLAEELAEQAGTLPPAETSELSRLIADQSAEVAAIVEDLLVVARAATGALRVLEEEVDLAAETRAALGPDDDFPFEVRDPTRVSGDPMRIRQIVRNLVQNARRYGGDRIRIVVDGNAVEVRDDGPPIDPAFREVMFDPYVRSDERRAVTGSIGLGLSVSRQLAEAMGGELVYHHDGDEAIFRLTLPVVAAADQPSAAASARAT
ncbi:MAG TPA: HAMP domain-containing histidine kinase [Actinobacteria bacterium]|nr:HAMP domain-containing histidine kinase [Actinomycetota bacterium]